jgi:DNA-binding FadR family transcriptional regulator
MITSGSDVPAYVRLAEALRARIEAGEFAGRPLPSEVQLGQAYGVGRNTVRGAVALLRNEGVLDVRHGVGTFVRDQEREKVTVPAPATVATRAPTAAEREQLGIDRGVMVLAVRSADGERVWPADQYVIEVTAATGRRGGSR